MKIWNMQWKWCVEGNLDLFQRWNRMLTRTHSNTKKSRENNGRNINIEIKKSERTSEWTNGQIISRQMIIYERMWRLGWGLANGRFSSNYFFFKKMDYLSLSARKNLHWHPLYLHFFSVIVSPSLSHLLCVTLFSYIHPTVPSVSTNSRTVVSVQKHSHFSMKRLRNSPLFTHCQLKFE